MTRAILAVASAVFATTTLLAPAAEACISCNYVPEVVNTPSPGYAAKRQQKKRVQIAGHERKSTAPAKAAPAKRIAKVEPAPKPAETAKAAPADTPAESRTEAAAETETETETSSVKVADASNVGCKKFSATIGTTITVPCE